MYCGNCGAILPNDAAFCGTCGMQNPNFMTNPVYACCGGTLPSERPRKRKMRGICLTLLAILIIIVAGYFVRKAQMPWFELSESGTLHFDYDKWEFYEGEILEIPPPSLITILTAWRRVILAKCIV